MWFRPGGGQATIDIDKFRVSSFKKRIRGRKSPVKSSSLESDNITSQSVKSQEEDVDSTKLHNVRASTDPPVRRMSKSLGYENGKEKILLTDRKFKNNRIEKSSSKTKVNDLEKRESLKNRGSRKISAPPVLDGGKSASSKKNVRAHSNLNLNALVKLMSSNRKLSSEEFERIRRKSLSEAASSAIAVATCKPQPLNSKCEGGDIADDVTNDNVVLVKHDIKDSFDDTINNNKLEADECNCANGIEINDSESKMSDTNLSGAPKKSSPSLTSRVAAKITETTNNYKNRRKTPKKRKGPRRPEFYKQLSTDRPHSTSVVRQQSDRRPDLSSTPVSSSGLGSSASHNTNELTTSQSLDNETSALDAENDSKRDRSKSKSAPVSVNRSESYKERLSHKRNRNNRRKISDPSLSKTADEQSELGLSNDNYTASSSSSLSSSSLESPSTSLEQVSGPGAQTVAGGGGGGGPMITATGTIPTPRQWVDSEDEADLAEVVWSSNISAEILVTLSDAEKKRQEIINEIYQTERSHVRTLRLLEGIFMRPLLESGVLPYDHLQLLFPPALITLKDLHSSFEQKLKMRRVEHGHIVKFVGDLLVGVFEGQSGDELREYAAQFCARQQIALEALKEKRRKDENLQRLLTKAESHKACRRLQLKDLLPTVLQRLTKYPLLFENLYKITKRVIPDDEHEADAIQKALDSSKRILVDVNQAVKHAEDAHKLQTIQRKLDKSSFDKDASNEFKNLDLTQYKLVYDGQLVMKKNQGVQLHGLLFENMIVLLQKQDDKYFLKYFPNNAAGTNENNKLISPITHFDQQTLVRQSAVDKNAFFLIITKTSQMLELRAPSSSECKTWFKHISDAAEQYKPRSKSSHEVVEDPASTTLPHSNTKESFESTPDRTASVSSNNNNASTTDTSGYQQDQSHINSSSTPYDKAKHNLVNNNSAAADNQKEKYESNNNASTEYNEAEKEETVGQNREDARRDSVYSNNSNNTRTLMQHCPLLEPSEIQISISPAHTAEPILTPTERLKRLDEAIRERLAEKQKIICDMFRVPNEHFIAIADIAGQPEAPKDTSDIVLATFAQVQSLTEVLSEYMKVTPEQEISAVSTAICDQCHQRNLRSISPMPSSIASTNTGTTVIPSCEAGHKEQLDDTIIQEDDGYCEIDALRLPSVTPNPMKISKPPGAPVSHISTSTPELTKRQSTISVDSIPEESEQDVTNDGNDLSSNSKYIEKDESTAQSESVSEEQHKVSDDSTSSEHIEVNDAYDTTTSSSLTKTAPEESSHYDESTETQSTNNPGSNEFCGPNRLSHVNSLGPSIPCHAIIGIVTTLGAQVSLLLPKIKERDLERDRLRRENQHLRELLNAMHERQRVEEEKETPEAATKSIEKSDQIAEEIEPSEDAFPNAQDAAPDSDCHHHQQQRE